VTMLVFLLLVGRWLQTRQQRLSRSVTDLMFAMAPSTSRLIEGGAPRLVPTASLQVGAVIELRAGERIGVDGVVQSGTSQVDESLLTGESQTRRVAAGAKVHAGTLNASGVLRVLATKTGSETRLSGIVRDVEAAAARRAKIAVLADRASGTFTLVVLAFSVLTFFYWLPHSLRLAAEYSIALLIVTCPCALGLATPLASAVTLARLARRGILVKGMSPLEHLATPGLFVLDKTGTLTQGQLELVHQTFGSELGSIIKAAEQGSNHPVAQAISRDIRSTAHAQQQWELVEFQEFPGLGIAASLRNQSAPRSTGCLSVQIGSERFVREKVPGVVLDEQSSASLLGRGLSPVHVVVNGVCETTLGFGDPIREEAKECLAALRSAGHKLVLLSGDQPELVCQVADALRDADGSSPFLEVHGGQTPEQKLAFVENAAKKGLVFMVGDGANDAGALSAASVGIAVSGGAEASLAAADAFATRAGLTPLRELVAASLSTMRVIHRNLAFSLLYNIAAAGLAMSGNISPIIAAVLMPVSSLTVVLSSLAPIRSKLEQEPTEPQHEAEGPSLAGEFSEYST